MAVPDIDLADYLEAVFIPANERLKSLSPQLDAIAVCGGELEITVSVTEIEKGKGFRFRNIIEQKYGQGRIRIYWQTKPAGLGSSQ